MLVVESGDDVADRVIRIPHGPDLLLHGDGRYTDSTYHVVSARYVDKPRNLAKTVTAE